MCLERYDKDHILWIDLKSSQQDKDRLSKVQAVHTWLDTMGYSKWCNFYGISHRKQTNRILLADAVYSKLGRD
jgi:hypothetical protein